jgi:hypothetical protein
MRTFALLAACAAEFLAAGSAVAQSAVSHAPGTYETTICRGPCGARGSRVLVTGKVVLQDPKNTPAALPDACFVLARPDGAGTYAGITDPGTTCWTLGRDGSISISLFRSPGAGYDAKLSLTADGFRGRGKAWGGGAAADYIVGRRIAPPDVGLCADVSREATERRARALPPASLPGRAAALLYALRWEGKLDSIRAFFPRTGHWTYVHTSHEADGDRRGIWRFPGSETPRVIDYGGPIPHVFTINHHGQPIGLLVHQVMLRGAEWRRVAGNRYVPPGASARSPTFIEWRREGDSWVVSALGDESFPGGDVPWWCC